ncbi:MAG: hypothetical protein RIC87_06455 [Kiloniellales bacterium]
MSEVVMATTLRLPASTLFEGEASKILARGPQGAFCLLPRHADLASTLVASVVTLVRPDGRELFFGIDEGSLVKAGPVVRLCAFRALRGESLADVRDWVEDAFERLADSERRARSALARLEADAARRFAELVEPAS